MEFVLIPAGTFLMGSPENEAERSDNEVQHEVEITRPFSMGVYQVTQDEYQRLAPGDRVIVTGALERGRVLATTIESLEP